MIQVQLNLPLYDNNGKSVKKIHKQLVVELCSKFGGCTTSSGRGKWIDNGKLYNDSLNIYQVAIDKKLKNLFIKIAKKYGIETGQLAIYLVINGQVKIINL
jgi:hypothetical protein